MIAEEQIAHDLAMAYIHNRYGAEVTGQFSVGTWDDEVSGSGDVETVRLPHVDKARVEQVGTGEKYFFGLLERKESIESGYEVDFVFENMVADYHSAFSRFLELLQRREGSSSMSDLPGP